MWAVSKCGRIKRTRIHLSASFRASACPQNNRCSLAGVIHGLQFSTGGNDYEVRISPAGFGTFELYRCADDAQLCTKISELVGGYGTTGARLVFSMPTAKVGLQDGGGAIGGLTAFSAVGSIQAGPAKVLDSVPMR